MHSHVVRVGTTLSLGTSEPTIQVFKPIAIIIHEHFNKKQYHNDVALIKLDRPAVLNGLCRCMLINKTDLRKKLCKKLALRRKSRKL